MPRRSRSSRGSSRQARVRPTTGAPPVSSSPGDLRSTWNPRAGVTVYRPGDRALRQVSEGEYVLSVTPVATVDEAGDLAVAGDAGDISLPFTLARQDDGQWRITKAPDGVVLDRNRFERVYSSYDLQFFDPSWTYLVPDTRWFPMQYAATSIAEALVERRSEHLARGCGVDRVRRRGTPRPGGGAGALERGVGVTAAGRALARSRRARPHADPARDEPRAGRHRPGRHARRRAAAGRRHRLGAVDTHRLLRPLVRTADAFGFALGRLGVARSRRCPGSPARPAAGRRPRHRGERRPHRSRGARYHRRRVDGRQRRHGHAARRPTGTRRAVGRPAWVHLVGARRCAPRRSSRSARAAPRCCCSDAWPAASQIAAQRISRDGTRLAAMVRDGERSVIWVAGIFRDRDGVPTGLGAIRVLGVLPGPGHGADLDRPSTLAAVDLEPGHPVALHPGGRRLR